MSPALSKLVSIGSASTRSAPFDASLLSSIATHSEKQEVESLLGQKNGFYAFEGALHVLSDMGNSEENGIVAWNDRSLWRQDYEGMADSGLFFAEDVFGNQFVLRDNVVWTFDPETGMSEEMAHGIEDWAEKVLADFGFWTGHPVAHEWQASHGQLPLGARLLPVRPFVLGGEFSVENLRALNDVQGMKYRASLAVQIRDLPDGASVKFQVID